jgi:hypothetical protein
MTPTPIKYPGLKGQERKKRTKRKNSGIHVKEGAEKG